MWQTENAIIHKRMGDCSYNNYSKGIANVQPVDKLRITLSGREVIEYVLSDGDKTIDKLDSYFGLL